MNDILKLSPQNLWKYFYDITQIPHPSKHEGRISEYIVNFAKNNSIEYKVDKIGNIILRKPATKGMEMRKGIVMQGHLDMVPQKNSDKNFDFTKDSLSPHIDGEWVTADGTTLGADNGIGIAAILSVMASNKLQHGDLEALLTINEEAGLEGASELDRDSLKADILLNLDSEDEGELYVGCAGVIDVNALIAYQTEASPKGFSFYKLLIKGLKGGHSGMDIILQRGNSNKMLVRFLKYAQANFPMRLSHIDGGGLRNAIPRESFAVVAIPNGVDKEFSAAVNSFEKTYKDELSAVENNISFTIEPHQTLDTVIDLDSQEKFINSVYACPNGVIRMSDSMKGLVETSLNLARVISEDGEFKIYSLLRSSVNSAKDNLVEMVSSAFELADAQINKTGEYDGWKPNIDSPILKLMSDQYQALYGKMPEVKTIHAGLECGIIGGKYPNMDMISFGPTIRYPHSPDEKVNIESVEKFWDFLINILKNAPTK